MKKGHIFILIFIILLFGLPVLSYFYVSYALHRVDSNSEIKEIRVENGMTVSEIGDLLVEKKLINSKVLFYLYVKYKGFKLEAGVYNIPSNLSVTEIVQVLRHGKDDVQVIVVEGLRREEIADLLSGKLSKVNKAEFLEKTKELEGRLFPDTYFFASKETTDNAIKKLTDNFAQKTKDVFLRNKTGLSSEDVLTLASLVEREEPQPLERPIIAGILIGRLKGGEILGVDATIQYLLGKPGNWWSREISEEDLIIDSPFNSRKNAGLPPHPICNPGLSAIKSVVDFKTTDFKYYLHDKEGRVHYAKTLEEHQKNIFNYLNK